MNNSDKQAILIMAHANTLQLKQLLQALDFEGFDIHLHLDKKSSIQPKDLQNTVSRSGLFIYKKISVGWASFSQIKAELFLLKKAKEQQNYCYYHLISGSDFPLISAESLYHFFANSQYNYLNFMTKDGVKQVQDWIKYYHFFVFLERNPRLWVRRVYSKFQRTGIQIQKRLGINRLKHWNPELAKGANWFSITDDLASYVLSQSSFIRKHFRFCKSGDEFFLQTICWNSDFRNSLFRSDWKNDYEACLRYIDWNRGSPYTFLPSDLEELKAAGEKNYVFARKMDIETCRLLKQKI